jgi:hypothetical protein
MRDFKDYQYMGCYNETTDDLNAGRLHAIQGFSYADDYMSIDDCLETCKSDIPGFLPFTYAGLEYSKYVCFTPSLTSSSRIFEWTGNYWDKKVLTKVQRMLLRLLSQGAINPPG